MSQGLSYGRLLRLPRFRPPRNPPNTGTTRDRNGDLDRPGATTASMCPQPPQRSGRRSQELRATGGSRSRGTAHSSTATRTATGKNPTNNEDKTRRRPRPGKENGLSRDPESAAKGTQRAETELNDGGKEEYQITITETVSRRTEGKNHDRPLPDRSSAATGIHAAPPSVHERWPRRRIAGRRCLGARAPSQV